MKKAHVILWLLTITWALFMGAGATMDSATWAGRLAVMGAITACFAIVVASCFEDIDR